MFVLILRDRIIFCKFINTEEEKGDLRDSLQTSSKTNNLALIMCGRYVTVTKTEVLEKIFNAQITFTPVKYFNASPSQTLPVITSTRPNKIQGFSFGYLAPWAKSKYKGQINIKSESILKQGSNSRNYHILVKKAARESRCVIIANCFIEWHDQTRQPYVVYVRDQHNILFAGVHKTWVDKATGEEIQSFGIITQEGNSLMHKIGHHRQPKILKLENYQNWLQARDFQDVSELLHTRMEPDEMNAYPIATLINKPANNSKEVIEPIGDRVLKEYDVEMKQKIELLGMGHSPARKRSRVASIEYQVPGHLTSYLKHLTLNLHKYYT